MPNIHRRLLDIVCCVVFSDRLAVVVSYFTIDDICKELVAETIDPLVI